VNIIEALRHIERRPKAAERRLVIHQGHVRAAEPVGNVFRLDQLRPEDFDAEWELEPDTYDFSEAMRRMKLGGKCECRGDGYVYHIADGALRFVDSYGQSAGVRASVNLVQIEAEWSDA